MEFVLVIYQPWERLEKGEFSEEQAAELATVGDMIARRHDRRLQQRRDFREAAVAVVATYGVGLTRLISAHQADAPLPDVEQLAWPERYRVGPQLMTLPGSESLITEIDDLASCNLNLIREFDRSTHEQFLGRAAEMEQALHDFESTVRRVLADRYG